MSGGGRAPDKALKLFVIRILTSNSHALKIRRGFLRNRASQGFPRLGGRAIRGTAGNFPKRNAPKTVPELTGTIFRLFTNPKLPSFFSPKSRPDFTAPR